DYRKDSYIDDITLCVQSAIKGTNYWLGGDMEGLSTVYSYIGSNVVNGSNPDGWLTCSLSNYSPVYAIPTTAEAHSGSYSLKLDFGGAVRAIGRRFKLQNGHTYKLTFWSKGSGNGFGIYNHDAADTTFECNNADNGIQKMKDYATELVYAKPYGKGEWKKFEYIFTLTEGDYVDIAWCSIATDYIDDITLYDTADVCDVVVDSTVNGIAGQVYGGTVSATDSSVLQGANVTVTATPNAGMVFDAWYVNGAAVSYNATETFAVNVNTKYVANFTTASLYNYMKNGDFEDTSFSPVPFHYTSNVWSDNGYYTPATEGYSVANVHSGSNSYRMHNESGQGVGNNWWVVPLKEGENYTLDYWYKGVQMGYGLALSDNSAITTLPSGWNGIDAMFTSDMTQLDVTKWGGTSSDNWKEFNYTFDVPVTDDDDDIMYLYILWCTNGHTAYVDDFSLVVTADSCEITVVAGTNGSAGLDLGGRAEGPVSVYTGTKAHVKAIPNEGYAFDGWYINGVKVSEDLECDLTVSKGDLCVANFVSTSLFNYAVEGDFETGKLSTIKFIKDAGESRVYSPSVDGYDASNVYSGDISFQMGNQSAQGVGINWWVIPLTEGHTYMMEFMFHGQQMGYGLGLSDKSSLTQLPAGWDGIGKMFTEDMTQLDKRGWGKMTFFDEWKKFEYTIDVPVTDDADTTMYLYVVFCTNGHFGYIDDFYCFDANDVAQIKVGESINGNYAYDSFKPAGAVTTSNLHPAKGEQFTVTAAEPNEGYTFDGWYFNGTKVSSNLVFTSSFNENGMLVANYLTDNDVDLWADGDMETIADKYAYLGGNIENGKNEDGWIQVSLSQGSQVQAIIDTDEHHSGDASMRLNFGGAVRALGRRFKLQNHHSYTVHFWGKGSDNGFGIYNHNNPQNPFLCANVDWGINENGKNGNSYELVRTHVMGDGEGKAEWKEYSFTFTLSEGDYVDIAWCTISDYWFDDITLYEHEHTFGGLIPASDSTCDKAGTIPHYVCSECNGVADENGIPTNWKYINKPTLPHAFYFVDEQAANCEEDGMVKHYACHNCATLFSDDKGTVAAAEALTIAATGHDFENFIERADPGCLEDGHKAYYECLNPGCGQLFNSNKEKIDEIPIIPKYHSLEGAAVAVEGWLPAVGNGGSVPVYTCPNAADCVTYKAYKNALSSKFTGSRYYSTDPTFTYVPVTAAADAILMTKTNATKAAKKLLPELEETVEYGGLTLGGDLSVNMYFDFFGYQTQFGIDEPVLEVYGLDENGEQVEEPFIMDVDNAEDYLAEGQFQLYSSLEEPISVRADQMSNNIVINLYDDDGNPVEGFHDGGTWTLSVQDILEQYVDLYSGTGYMANTQNADKIANLSKSCITYGGYAKYYFEQQTEGTAFDENYGYDIDISDVSTEDIADKKVETDEGFTGFKIDSATFMATSRSAVKFYYTLDDGLKIGDFTIVATLGGARINASNVIANTEENSIKVKDIGAGDLSSELILTVTDSNSNKLSATYNPLCFAKRMIEKPKTDVRLVDMCKALILYSQAADAYDSAFAE
ncbi:MAG: InlB B-repeat-containing protein, partial [Oscillospiraceae bacterium]|nr:InlB B-repeat-containing protein [Candidatus Equicaccousia limihippi]